MESLTIIGLFLNTLGSGVLAFALNKTTKMLHSSITALEHFKDTSLNSGDVISISGMDRQRKVALSNSNKLTNIGMILLIFGFILQILSLTLK